MSPQVKVITTANDILSKGTPGTPSDELRREAICERWINAIEDSQLDYEVPMPKKRSKKTMSATRADDIAINYIGLAMNLVYDREFSRCAGGNYGVSDEEPNIEIFIAYNGKCENERKRVLEVASNLISSHIKKPVTFSEDAWNDPQEVDDSGERFIESLVVDSDTAWNIADFILDRHGYE